MGGAVPPLLQYAFMAWCSVRGSTGSTPLPPPRRVKKSPTQELLKFGAEIKESKDSRKRL
jgi:hypothetical protein